VAIADAGVMQTGQPGPAISSTFFGSSCRSAWRPFSCSCVPQT
jgi:hypothetical protein